MAQVPNEPRYEKMRYNRCGRSGLKLPAIALGCWQNFGAESDFQTARAMLMRAFDLGVTYFDVACGYGPPPGSAETNVGRILNDHFSRYRDELIISTKAGYRMWPGPYGEWGSRKFLLASIDQSLKRLNLEYVDIFYSHRFDPHTPLEETMGALDAIVRRGKALYAGISNYEAGPAAEAAAIMRRLGTPLLVHQASYSMLHRSIEQGALRQTEREGMGTVAYCPLAQGLLTSLYLNSIPEDSRAARQNDLNTRLVKSALRPKLASLNEVAQNRGQSLAQMALTWVLRDPSVCSALIGASRVSQIEENVSALEAPPLSGDELKRIDAILSLPE